MSWAGAGIAIRKYREFFRRLRPVIRSSVAVHRARGALGCLVLAALLAISGCGGNGTPTGDGAGTAQVIPGHTCPEPIVWEPPQGQNMFANASFEDGTNPWCSLATEAWGRPFSVSTKRSRSGRSSALLELRSEEGVDTRVFGVLTEIAPDELPEMLSGYYYVDRWEKGSPKQYLQIVVIVWGASNIPREVSELGAGNHQIRYIVAGVDSQPTFIRNAQYVMISRDAPKTGEWVRFERNVRRDFEELWGEVPVDFAKVRVLFEVRWDNRTPADGPAAADVYYDDLYFGPARATAEPPD